MAAIEPDLTNACHQTDSVLGEMEVFARTQTNESALKMADFFPKFDGIVKRHISLLQRKKQLLQEKARLLPADLGVRQNLKETKKELLELRDCLRQVKELKSDLKMKYELETIYTRFYGTILNNYPKLHRHLDGVSLSEGELRTMHADIHDFLDENRSLKRSEKKRLHDVSQKLLEATLYRTGKEYLFWRLTEPDQPISDEMNPDQIAVNLHKRVTELKQGESLLIKGTWLRHCVLFEIRRDEDGYCFTIINTGDDEGKIVSPERNFVRDNSNPQPYKRWTYAHKSYRCDAQALNLDFLRGILPDKTQNTPAPEVVKQIDEALQRKGAIPQHGRQHHPQLRGNCTYKAVSSWLKGELIFELGEERGRAVYEKFKAFRTKHAIRELKHFEKTLPDEVLMRIYQTSSKRQLRQSIRERNEAAQEVYAKRRAKGKGRYQRIVE